MHRRPALAAIGGLLCLMTAAAPSPAAVSPVEYRFVPRAAPVPAVTPWPADSETDPVPAVVTTLPATAVQAPPAAAAPVALVPAGADKGIPSTVLAAYQAAEKSLAASDPSCALRWYHLAGIGQVESGHARGGRADATGETVPHILGPVLDGGAFAAIADSDGGRHDGDARWDRAVGPMQFIPSTWARYGADGNGDGVASPHNIADSALAAGNYLCSGSLDLSRQGDLDAAVFRYNHSQAYVQLVETWMRTYSDGAVAVTPLGPGSPDDEPAAANPKPTEQPADAAGAVTATKPVETPVEVVAAPATPTTTEPTATTTPTTTAPTTTTTTPTPTTSVEPLVVETTPTTTDEPVDGEPVDVADCPHQGLADELSASPLGAEILAAMCRDHAEEHGTAEGGTQQQQVGKESEQPTDR
ncbi:lytic transglycosylase domain-containing protein [Actinosynnema sp. NPDC020468]|uniref:lytic transglycosylase domain-containing protein n=1 Tax=Actinosynnema sp. NPDC020468 TaxID=3154488 RepID=UPI00340FBFA1